jgi:hypothetical protein
MRFRTAAVAVLVLAALGAVVAYSVVPGLIGGGSTAEVGGQVVGEEFSERWVSDVSTSLESNHHAPAGAFVDGESYVAIPINSRQGTVCALSVVDGDGAERWRTSIPEDECSVHSYSDPVIADGDGDGEPEVTVATSDGAAVVYDLETGREERRWALGSIGFSQPIVGNLTPVAGNETVVVDLRGGVTVRGQDGRALWTRALSDARTREPKLADLDADGSPELAVGQLNGGVVALEGDGRVAWRRNVTDAVALKWLTVGEIDGDEAVEVVVSTFTGRVLALDGRNGSVDWQRNLSAKGATVHAVGDGDGDGTPEVYAGARDGKLRSLSGPDGTVEWTTQLTTEPVDLMPPPSLGDVDGDDSFELVATTDDGLVAVVDPNTGEVTASYERDVPVRTFPTLTDYDGDGIEEVLVVYGDGRVVALSAG